MLRKILPLVLITLIGLPAYGQDNNDGWISLFNGKDLTGFKASENQGTFTVRDGMIIVNGERSHLFYTGPVENANFQDFEFKADIMTKPNANSGMYFHTEYKETGWPDKGFEIQVNNSHSDWRRTGSLYGIKDIRNPPAEDNEWFTQHIIVDGRLVTVKVNGKTVMEYGVPEGNGRIARRLSSGTFALQGHDPGSTVYYKNIMVRPLYRPDFPLADYHVHLKGGLTLEQAIENARQRGVKFGIAENCGLGFKVTNDEKLMPFIKLLEGKPVYTAMQAEGREWLTLFSPQMIAKFDYVFTDAMTFTDKQGRRTRLWMKDEVHIDDEQEFMDMYVDRIVSVLSEPIDIYVNPTFLPEVIAGRYDELWTPNRMDRVIEAAFENDVAIEINARYKIPSKAFIMRAKRGDVKFSFGTNNGDRDLGHLEYSRRMAKECHLTKEDMFTPDLSGNKSTQPRKK
ncbi:MAG: DUF1080 domain-containing protein [Sedimentisphaerales bacterium]|nr:DUF1080 domain-containing protein [Sedimentisphaerales bacterium]